MMAWATMSTLHGPPFVDVQLIPCGDGDTAFCHLRRQRQGSTSTGAGQPLTCPHIDLPLMELAKEGLHLGPQDAASKENFIHIHLTLMSTLRCKGRHQMHVKEEYKCL